ncbi:MAG: DUF2585 family protein [Anaerolineaceae bacterium]|nr:DUF2585 family protein [Anaerolineaceae bacterium]
MSTNYFQQNHKKLWPWLAMAFILILSIFLLRSQGRLWICSCGQVYLWVGDIWSADNSQHLLDPYAFSHLLHGVVFFWLLTWLRPQMPLLWRLCIAVGIEAAWEVFENSEMVIQRYRETTISLGYDGDTIVNSVSDIVAMGVGFMLAYKLGFRWSLILFIVVELVLLVWIRDSLTLNIIMLIYPIDAIKQWQMGLAP